jgi:glucose/arabinose dehydrogenase
MVSPRPSRRQFLGCLAASVSLAGCRDRTADRQTPTPMTDPPESGGWGSDLSVGASLVADGFVAPVGIEMPSSDRRYVTDQSGTVSLLAGDSRSTFLDLTDRIPDVSGTDERGLLGLAFHPAFDSNGRLFVSYSAPPDETTPSGYSHRSVLAEFLVDPGRPEAPPEFRRRILSVPQPQPNNNGGDIVFGPDGYLYVGLGDGGGAGDTGHGHASDWYDPAEGGNGQDIRSNLLGSILRIDVDDSSPERPYGIPSTNPLVGSKGRDEHYAWGFRNPRGLSFGPEGVLYAADAGEDRREEINAVESGGNYGWNVREGTGCFRRETCPRETADGDPLLPPIIEYEHEGDGVDGVAVVGGHLYDGSALGSLRGLYIFADWRAKGRLFAARPTDAGLWEISAVPVVDDVEPYVLALGRGREDELYLCANERGRVGGSSGAVYRLEPA